MCSKEVARLVFERALDTFLGEVGLEAEVRLSGVAREHGPSRRGDVLEDPDGVFSRTWGWRLKCQVTPLVEAFRRVSCAPPAEGSPLPVAQRLVVVLRYADDRLVMTAHLQPAVFEWEESLLTSGRLCKVHYDVRSGECFKQSGPRLDMSGERVLAAGHQIDRIAVSLGRAVAASVCAKTLVVGSSA